MESNVRQTGRTTRMLIEAYDAKVLGEQVLIISPNGEIRNSVMNIARSHGLFDGVRPLVASDFTTAHYVMQRKLRGYRGVIFEDHTVAEFEPPKAYSREVRLWQATIVPNPFVPVAEDTSRWKFQPF